MNKPLLSILIPTVVGRMTEWNNLLTKVFGQTDLSQTIGLSQKVGGYWMNRWQDNKEVEVISCYDEKQLSIGEKREIMYKEASGVFSWQIDDDDSISDNAIELILQAIKENPGVDVISFKERCNMNGEMKTSNHSIKYDKWSDNFDGYDYVRSIFYKDVIRTDIAKSVPFPRIRWNEDEQWSMILKPHIKTEHHIDEFIYYYNYFPTESHEERYGFDKSS